jgi:hypothetical protein
MASTSLPRQAATLLAPVALLALACGVHLASHHRGRPPHAEPVPAVDSFELTAAGGSALLRLAVDGIQDAGGAVLVIDRGAEIDVLKALPGRALAFACDRSLLDGEPAYRLEAGGRSITLPRPAERIL